MLKPAWASISAPQMISSIISLVLTTSPKSGMSDYTSYLTDTLLFKEHKVTVDQLVKAVLTSELKILTAHYGATLPPSWNHAD